ncbi:MAG: amidohydrolase family protein [bacterium]
MRIDAHQHFWKYDPVKHSWINDEMSVIRKDFGPPELHPNLKELNIDGTVAVQADETETETAYLLKLSAEHDFIKAVVGWVDLKTEGLEQRLEAYQQATKLVGFRAIMQGQDDEAYLTNPTFTKNVRQLADHGYTYDLLVFHHQLPSLIRFTDKLPDNKLILDHIAKPDIKSKNIKDWKEQMRILAGHPNIYCKLSGIITEADFKKWSYDDVIPYIETAAEYFGIDRICFGTDWPVCLVAGSYRQVYEIIEKFSSQLDTQDREKIFGINTATFYNL